MNEFDVVTVPSFGDFVAETTITSDSTPAARIVLGEKMRQHNRLPIVEVTLDLQGFNDCHELVWLSKSVTIAGFRRNGSFADPQKQARYEAMNDLQRIVEEQLEARGIQVRPGRHVLPDDHLPINGIFECAEWYEDEEEFIRVRPAPDWS
jgi:hypothetical protein